jgi:hypothetical protein
MALKNHADAAAQLLAGTPFGPIQLLTQHLNGALLHLAQGANQGEKGCFATPRRARKQDDLPSSHSAIDALKHLTAVGARTEPVLQALHRNGHGRGGVQKISAGSASAKRRMAREADPIHISKIMVNTVTARVVSMATGSWVALRTNA